MKRAKSLHVSSDGGQFVLKTAEEIDEEVRKHLEAYGDGDEYLVEQFDDRTLESAIQAVQSPGFLEIVLKAPGRGLECILSDRHARVALKKALLADDPEIVVALREYAKRPHKKSQAGRPAIIRDGMPMKAYVMKLTNAGLPVRRIAEMAGTTPGSVRAQRSQAGKPGKLPPKL